MVNLPAVFGIGVTMLRILHHLTTLVVPPDLIVVALNRLSCLPDSELGVFVCAFERICVCHGVCGGEFIMENRGISSARGVISGWAVFP